MKLILICLITVLPSMASLIGNDEAGHIYDVSTATGAATNGRGSGSSGLVGVAFGGGTLYGLTSFLGTPANSLMTINPTTGNATLVGATGLTSIFEGDVAFDPTTNTLYGLQDAPSFARNLFSINASTGAATVIGPVGSAGSDDFSAMAFNAAGTLYVINTTISGGVGANFLLTVNKSTGAPITSIQINGSGLGATAGMAFDPNTGTLYVAGGSGVNNNLYTLNTTTGNMTPVGQLGLASGLAGLTFTSAATVPGVPEPTTFSLFGLAAATLGLSRRVRKYLGSLSRK